MASKEEISSPKIWSLPLSLELLHDDAHQQQTFSLSGILATHPRRLGEADIAQLEAFIFAEACRLEHIAALQARVKDYLKAQRILLPADSTLVRLIGEQRQRARAFIY